MEIGQMVVCAFRSCRGARWTGGSGILDHGCWAALPMNNFRILIWTESRLLFFELEKFLVKKKRKNLITYFHFPIFNNSIPIQYSIMIIDN